MKSRPRQSFRKLNSQLDKPKVDLWDLVSILVGFCRPTAIGWWSDMEQTYKLNWTITQSHRWVSAVSCWNFFCQLIALEMKFISGLLWPKSASDTVFWMIVFSCDVAWRDKLNSNNTIVTHSRESWLRHQTTNVNRVREKIVIIREE